MNKQTLIGMLRQGNTGAEILSILDAITAPDVKENAQPTMATPAPTSEWIDF